MPEMRFTVRWPDGSESVCYSPSLVIRDYLSPGARYGIAEFVSRAGTALTIASDRVQQKYGMPCTRAIGQLAQIRASAASFTNNENGCVLITGFDP